jgi:hypothetical protein
MNATLLTAGLACAIAGIIGGGLKAWGIQVPVLASVRRQLILIVFGVLLVVASGALNNGSDTKRDTQISNGSPNASAVTNSEGKVASDISQTVISQSVARPQSYPTLDRKR